MNNKISLYGIYNYCDSQADMNKLDKIILGINNGTITKQNYYDSIEKLTKKVTSKTSLDRWKYISRVAYEYLKQNEKQQIKTLAILSQCDIMYLVRQAT